MNSKKGLIRGKNMENKQSVDHAELVVGIVAGMNAARLIVPTLEPFWVSLLVSALVGGVVAALAIWVVRLFRKKRAG
jgi:ABC-type enterobactin transport system permease subunit